MSTSREMKVSLAILLGMFAFGWYFFFDYGAAFFCTLFGGVGLVLATARVTLDLRGDHKHYGLVWGLKQTLVLLLIALFHAAAEVLAPTDMYLSTQLMTLGVVLAIMLEGFSMIVMLIALVFAMRGHSETARI